MTLTCETPCCNARAMFSVVLTLGEAKVVRRYCYTCSPTAAALDSLAANVHRHRPESDFTVAILSAAA
jgi:hypothetical protein